MRRCIKEGCNNQSESGKQLCHEHTEEWNKTWRTNGNVEWERYIHIKAKVPKEKVEFT